MKIAVLFRGPVRPNNQSVMNRVIEFLYQFQNTNIEIHTYLATWRYHNDQRAADLIATDFFHNVIMQSEPTIDQVRRATDLTLLKNGSRADWVYNMFYQSKTALDLIHAADNYDFIVHTRTDIQIMLHPYMHQWFDSDNYVTLHTYKDENSWINDQFGVAPAAMMQRAWDYGTLENLGRLMKLAEFPEMILQRNMIDHNIPVKTGQYSIWQLDPTRRD